MLRLLVFHSQPYPLKILPSGEMSFPSLSAGNVELDLSQSSTIPGEIEIDARSDTTPTVIEVSSEDEVEITQILSTAQEIDKMKEEERYGHYYRVVDRQKHIEDRLKAVRKSIAAEDPESRKVRRQSFQRAVHGDIQ